MSNETSSVLKRKGLKGNGGDSYTNNNMQSSNYSGLGIDGG